MRYTRPALAITTAILALTGLATTAHADDDAKDHDKNNICFIHVEGDHNHNACGNIEYGANATTGQGHSVISGLTTPIQQSNCIDITNNLPSGAVLTLTPPSPTSPNPNPPASAWSIKPAQTIANGEAALACANGSFAGLTYTTSTTGAQVSLQSNSNTVTGQAKYQPSGGTSWDLGFGLGTRQNPNPTQTVTVNVTCGAEPQKPC
ncbi:hypothetical protein [Streptomyces sp. NPDC086023]|uniref:hypothetical protein n=1 Tax=Streptomyces sp. NPDC086023 TaxID=3365746 RepID=UPI0037D07354